MSYQRVIITKFGGPEVLKVIEEVALPEPSAWEVRIKVIATSAAFTDVMIRKGKYPDVKAKPPFSPGYDMVGIVDKLGESVSKFQVGQRVADLTVIGAYSEYICLPADRLTAVPESLDSTEAVSLVLSYLTAYQLLHRVANVRRRQRILVHGAGGVVGTAILQLGKLLHLEMYGTDSKDKLDEIERLGATPIDYMREDYIGHIRRKTGDGVDAVFDPIGGNNLPTSFSMLRQGGILVAYGFYNNVIGKGGSIPFDLLRLQLWNLLPNNRSTKFFSIGTLRHQEPGWFSEDLTTLFDLLVRNKIKPIIGAVMHMSEARHAHELIERANVSGKIVLRVSV
jgi:NADPH:quinone reductase-like Zn-dependent oxidoreductase